MRLPSSDPARPARADAGPRPLDLHASAVARDGLGILLLGPSGSGKSHLAIALIDRGFVLVGDDRIVLDGDLASPAPGLEGLIELRGFGIVRLPGWRPARVVLTLDLSAPVERLPAPGAARGPGTVPLRLGFDPRAPDAAARIAVMLDCLDPGRPGALVVGASAAARPA